MFIFQQICPLRIKQNANKTYLWKRMIYLCVSISGYIFVIQFSDVKPAEKVSAGFEVNYEVDPCDKDLVSSLNSAVDTKLQNSACLLSGTCQQTLSNSPCQTGKRKKRSQADVLALYITLTLDIGDLDLGSALQNLFENNTGNVSREHT